MTRIQAFKAEIAMKGKAVINMDARFLFKIVNESEEYLSYQRAVEQSKRHVMDFENDLRRCVVETAFYGFTGRNIVYATLSLDEKGLRSYGNVSVVLRTKHIERRTTVFEKDSYLLFDELTNKGWKTGTIMPTGHCGTWNERTIVASIKHGLEVAILGDLPNFAGIILDSDGKHKLNDEFIELHIFGNVKNVNLEKVTFLKKLGTQFEEEELKVFKLKLQQEGTEIVES